MRVSLPLAAAFSFQGSRPVQEDSVYINVEKGIFAVSDGFGGGEAGRWAAQEACEGIREFLEKEAGDVEATLPFVLRSYYTLPSNILFNALLYANKKILDFNKDKNVHEKGGASLLSMVVEGGFISLAGVGGCSAWLLRRRKAKELVIPKTYSRFLNPFQNDRVPDFEIPLMALGISEDLEPEISEAVIQKGDWVLMHTDGIGDEIRDRILELQVETGLQALSQAKMQEIYAKTQGRFKRDNASLLLIAFDF